MEEREKAREIAARLTAARMYTCREVYDRLLRRGISNETAQAVVEEFLHAGILNDLEYAKLYIADGIRLKAKGVYRIQQELIQKGISRKVMEEALGEMEEKPDQTEVLREYLRLRLEPEKIRSRRDVEKWKAKLLRRGFGRAEIHDCLSAYAFHFDDMD